jgi:peptide alpha-N-acetyltransferase
VSREWLQVLHKGTCVGTVVCKMDQHRGQQFRGYIAMLVVDKPYRKLRLGSKLVCQAFQVMIAEGVEEVMLEAETNNHAALKLYENLGFIRDKRLHKYALRSLATNAQGRG